MTTASFKVMLEASLRQFGYSGLTSADCPFGGCSTDDLMPCQRDEVDFDECKPAIEKVCPHCGGTVYMPAYEGGKL